MKKSNKIKVIVKPPHRIAHFEWIDNTLESLQKIVEGPIEVVTLTPGLCIVCNEEGKLRGLEANCRLYHPKYMIPIDTFVGTIMAVGSKKEEFSDVHISLAQFMSMVS